MNNFFVKGLSGVFLTSLVCSANNFCSACREFPDWFYGEGEIPKDGAEWFSKEFLVRARSLINSCVELGKNFNEDNKNNVKKSFVNCLKFFDALYVRNITLDEFVKDENELFSLIRLIREQLWWVRGSGLFFLTKSYYMNNRTDDQKKAADFINGLKQKWVDGKFGAGF